jgi:hypothetical protein
MAFVMLPHRREEPNFLYHLSNVHLNIQLTMETESNGPLCFLDIEIYRRPCGSSGHIVHRIPFHTNL